MTDEARNAYENLILMCPNHHALVDDLEPKRFTVETLEWMKRRIDERATTELRGRRELWTSDEHLTRFASAAIASLSHTSRVSSQEVAEPATPASTAFAEAVREYRSQHRLTEEDFARELQVPKRRIAAWERGDSLPDISEINHLRAITPRLAGVLGAFMPTGPEADWEAYAEVVPSTDERRATIERIIRDVPVSSFYALVESLRSAGIWATDAEVRADLRAVGAVRKRLRGGHYEYVLDAKDDSDASE